VVLHDYPMIRDESTELRAWLDGPRPPLATPRPAATVLLLRPAAADPGQLEVFLLRRQPSMAFAPRMHVYPGGGIDPRDADTPLPWVGPTPQEWGRELHCPTTTAAAIVCAAVRELFEECGVLLAGPSEDAVVADLSGADWERDRLALLDRSLALSGLLERRGLVLRSDLLRAWAHWTTPEFEPRRFDTWFFLAAMPDDQHARHIAEEADRTMWVTLDDLIHGEADGRLAMLPPTIATATDVRAAVRAAAGREPVVAALASPRVVRRVMPWLVRTDDGGVRMVVDLDGRGGGAAGVSVDGAGAAGLA
jgi:8-oxo-dGTP pyrophosphatase MutT (NUDIX family)